MVTIGGMQRATTSAAAQGARVYHAAHTGVEWGIYQALNAPPGTMCSLSPAMFTSPPFSLPVPGIEGFSVSVTCSYTSHRERNPPEHNAFVITSTATYDNLGNPDFVSRRIQVTVTDAPSP